MYTCACDNAELLRMCTPITWGPWWTARWVSRSWWRVRLCFLTGSQTCQCSATLGGVTRVKVHCPSYLLYFKNIFLILIFKNFFYLFLFSYNCLHFLPIPSANEWIKKKEEIFFNFRERVMWGTVPSMGNVHPSLGKASGERGWRAGHTSTDRFSRGKSGLHCT